ncbi:hypothetical protein [Rhodoligotrophos ferricapiens]
MNELHAPYHYETAVFGSDSISGSIRLVSFIGALALVGGTIVWLVTG